VKWEIHKILKKELLLIHSTTKKEINVNESERKLDKLTIYNKPLKIRSIVLTVVLLTSPPK
jgi:hypothetical protein